MKTKIYFLCKNNDLRSVLAESYAAKIAPAGVEIYSGGVEPAAEFHPLTKELLQEKGLDTQKNKPSDFFAYKLDNRDIVVSLCDQAAEKCSLYLPGQPTIVNWSMRIPEGDNLDDFRGFRDKIFQLVDDFFKRGYFKAITQDIIKDSLVLDSLSEGIIVHDINRKVMFFNSAAEKITGFSKSEVIGNDCHNVFPGKFCGHSCSFCEDIPPEFDNVKYAIEMVTKSGERKRLEMNVNAIRNDDKDLIGVLASFKDLSKEYALARRLGEVENFNGIIGKDKVMLEVFDLVRSVAESNVPVLIQGESGTGKELIAAATHNASPRAKERFITVNCGALPEGLLESELFGHEKGSFTGAIRDKKGRFELADGGSIFLDEIGDISQAMQVKLLRVLQEGTFERVGGQKTLKVNVRIISATNKDLQEEIREGRFREDLYYRLCVVPIYLPPLRERPSDIPLLVEHILNKTINQMNRENVVISPEAMDVLFSYNWPGNVRELQNAIQFSMVRCRTNIIEPQHLPPNLANMRTNIKSSVSSYKKDNVDQKPAGAAAKKGRRKLDVESVSSAIEEAGGNKVEAAKLLGVGRATLYRFLNDNEV